MAAMAVGVGGWAATTEFSGAVIAPGALVVESNIKKVQHPSGGVVGELRVRDGDRVKAGEVLVRLDETLTRANLAVVLKNLDELTVRQARLEAERDGLERLHLPEDVVARAADPQVARVVLGEQRLFGSRRSARAGQVAQLRERVAQLNEQIQGLTEQIAGKKREIELIRQELEGVRELWRKNLVPISRVTALERDAARLTGEHGALVSNIAQTKGKITETELQILQVGEDLRTEVGKELADIRAKVSELAERRVAGEDQLKRIDIRAPQDGMVHQLAVHTVGGVISPGEPLMLIVPDAEALAIEVKIAPHEIDQVRVGHRADLEVLGLQSRDHAGAQGRGFARISRSDDRSQVWDEFLHGAHCRLGGRNGAPRATIGAGHAGRGLRANGRADGAVVSDETHERSADEGLARTLTRQVLQRAVAGPAAGSEIRRGAPTQIFGRLKQDSAAASPLNG